MSDQAVSYGLLSSSSPTPCGIATFSAALGAKLVERGSTVSVVRVLDSPSESSSVGLPVVSELIASDASSIDRAIDALNRCDVAVVQHEYGLYGGADGSDVVKVINGLRIPSIVIVHTVLSSPTAHQIQVLNDVISGVDVVVVMSETAATTLRHVNKVDDTSLVIIPHGAAVVTGDRSRAHGARPRLLTWGLLGPGKGIEWAIDAMALLQDLNPMPLYVVAGRTHPKVLARQGDKYRESLLERVAKNDLGHMVHFDNSYRTLPALNELIQSADVVVLPYDSHDQATSGVLVDALAAGLPVVATAFPHARELLTSGAGSVVAHEDPAALADALRSILTLPELLDDMAIEARVIAASLSWDNVASEYQRVTQALLESVVVGA
ncbi:MAG TPA: glycosyltransferase [Acidimicrobiales bacterium]